MPRRPRRTIPEVTYHLISRFVDREWFISTERERGVYLRFLGEALEHSSWRCLGFAVMSNHIHLAVVASEQPLAEWIRKPHSAFADWMNRTHKRIGCVFVRGPKSLLTPDGRVGHLLAYIHNNPVRANLVATPGESTWTSHRYYANPKEPRPRWLDVDEGLKRANRARDTFDEFVRTTSGHPVLGDVETDEQFALKLEAYERQQFELVERPHVSRADPVTLLSIAAARYGLTVEQVQSKRRSIAERQARAVVVICGARLGLSNAELAACLNMTPQAVLKTLARDDVPQEVEAMVAVLLELLSTNRAA